MKPATRNIVIFALIVLTCGFVGIAVDQVLVPASRMEGLGVLIWLISPLVASLLLRAFGGDGWRDFGLGLGQSPYWPAYLAAMLIPFATTLLVLGLALGFGAVTATLPAGGYEALLAVFGVAFAGSAVKNLFEEFAWRGYLTPRLDALQVRPIIGWAVTGLIWASWHIPYYFYFLDPETLASQTSLSPIGLIGLALVLLPLQSIAYSELRLRSGSVWPAWLLHTVANALAAALFLSGAVSVPGGLGVLLSPGTEGVLYSVVMGLFGLALWRTRTRP